MITCLACSLSGGLAQGVPANLASIEISPKVTHQRIVECLLTLMPEKWSVNGCQFPSDGLLLVTNSCFH